MAEVVNFDALPVGKTLVGHLYGGIHAMGPQISFVNPSYANNMIYEVYVQKTGSAQKANPTGKPK